MGAHRALRLRRGPYVDRRIDNAAAAERHSTADGRLSVAGVSRRRSVAQHADVCVGQRRPGLPRATPAARALPPPHEARPGRPREPRAARRRVARVRARSHFFRPEGRTSGAGADEGARVVVGGISSAFLIESKNAFAITRYPCVVGCRPSGPMSVVVSLWNAAKTSTSVTLSEAAIACRPLL